MLKKPESKEELIPPFRWIGEDGWDSKARQILLDFEVPLPEPTSATEVQACEEALGVTLPEPFKLFHQTLGAVDFGVPSLFSLKQLTKPLSRNELYFFEALSAEEKAMLNKVVLIGEPADDFLILSLEDGRCAGLYHDPPGFANWLPSFHELIQCAFIGLNCGYYGWPDEEIEECAESLMVELYGVRL